MTIKQDEICLTRFERLYAQVLELFEGDAVAARAWLLQKQPALGDVVPVELFRTETGSREVEDLVGRLEDGVYS